MHTVSSRAVCAAVAEMLRRSGPSHQKLNALFMSSGASEPPPDIANLAHDSKWKEWLFRLGQDPEVDSLTVLGNVLEECMDVAPNQRSPEWKPEYEQWKADRERVIKAL